MSDVVYEGVGGNIAFGCERPPPLLGIDLMRFGCERLAPSPATGLVVFGRKSGLDVDPVLARFPRRDIG